MKILNKSFPVIVLFLFVCGIGFLDDFYSVSLTNAADDTIAPVISVGTDNIQVLGVGTSPYNLNVTAIDNIDGNITSEIVTSGNIDVNTIGTYELKYNVSDGSGNSAEEVEQTVHVVNLDSPSETLVGYSSYFRLEDILNNFKYVSGGTKILFNDLQDNDVHTSSLEGEWARIDFDIEGGSSGIQHSMEVNLEDKVGQFWTFNSKYFYHGNPNGVTIDLFRKHNDGTEFLLKSEKVSEQGFININLGYDLDFDSYDTLVIKIGYTGSTDGK